MKLYIIRHGETQMNRKKILQGNSDSPLTESGMDGAKKIAEQLKAEGFDLVISSHLGRAIKTAEIIMQGRDIPIVQEPLVSEMCFGDWQGKTQEEICIDEISKQNYINYFKYPEKYVPVQGAETFKQLLDRAESFLRKMMNYSREHPEDKVLLVTHGAYIKALLSVVSDLDIKDFWKEPFITNLSLTILDIKENEIKTDMEAVPLLMDSIIMSAAGYLK